MAASPSNILRRIDAPDGKASIRDVRKAFIRSGYGPGKAMKWISVFLNEGILEEVGRDPSGDTMVRSDWWMM